MNFDGGTIRYTIDVDSEGAEHSFDNMQQKAENLAGAFKELERGEEIESLQKGIEFLTKKLETLDQGTEEYKLTARTLVQQLEELDKIQKEVEEEVAKAAEETRKAQEEMAKAAQAASEALVNNRVQKMSSLWGSFTKVATGAATALSALATKGVSATNFLETSQTAMSGLLGSMEEGKKAMGIAADFWSNNPFNRFDVTNATKQLVQYGRTVDQLNEDLYILKDVSLSTGMGIDELAIRYGRVASSGRAMTLDIETMANRGVPIYRELAKVLNTTQAGVRELASQGKIDFEIFKQAMEGAVDSEALERYEQTLDRAKDKLSGSVTTLAGALAGYKIVNSEIVIANEGLYRSWVKLLKTIAGNSKEGTGLRNPKLIEGLTKIGEALGKLIDKISENVEPVFKALGEIVGFLGDHLEALLPIAIGALSFLTQFGAKIPILGNLFGGLAGKIGDTTKSIMKLIAEKPLLIAFIAILSVSLVDLIKNDEEFRKSLQELFSSLTTIVKKVLPVIQLLVQAFVALAQSSVIQGGIKLIVGLLANLAQLLSNMPMEVLVGIVAAILAVKLSAVNPWLVWITAIGLVVSALKNLAPEFMSAAKNAVFGFVNGIVDAGRQAVKAVVDLANKVVQVFKNALGIHSPSTVMAGVGLNVGLGLAEGITSSSSAVDRAMNNLATDIIKTANSVIGNKRDFKLIDVNGVYKEWKKVANLFTIGSTQYAEALEKMEDARKNVNLEILSLQEAYNDKLDESIKKIQNFYDIFDDVSTKGGKNATQIIKNLDKQVSQTAEWAEAQKIISGLNLDPRFIKELQEMGVGSVNELSSIANMTADELEKLNTLWLQKQALATDTAVDQLSDFRKETLDEIGKLADGIDGETVKVEDVGGRLVASLGEGITGAIPTLESAFSQLGDYIAEATKEATGSSSGGTGTLDTDLGNTDSVTDTIADLFSPDKIADAIQDKLSQVDWGKLALYALGGLAAGVAAKKGLSLLGTAISSKLGSKGGILGKIFGGGATSAASSIPSVTSAPDLSGVNNTATQLGETSKSLSKANEWIKTITKGALAIVAIAAAIAAIAGAIWVMDKALEGIEWGTFISKLGMVVLATAAMGALSYAMGEAAKELGWDLLAGILAIVAIAGEIAVLGLAMGVMANAIPNDLGNVQIKLLLVYEAVIVMGILTAAIGVVIMSGIGAAAMIAGLIAIVAIAGEIALVGLALGTMANAIPDDLGLVQMKLLLVYEAVMAFELLTGLAGVFAMFEGLGILVVLGIAADIAEVAIALGIMADKIPNDLNMVQDKLNLVKSAIQQMSEANLGNAIGNIIQSARIAALKPTIDEFVNIAQSMKQLEGINVSRDDVFGIMGALDAIIGSGDTLVRFTQVGSLAAQSVAQGVQAGLQFIYQAGNAIQSALWQGVQDKFADEYQQGVYLVKQVADGAWSVVPEFQKIGNDVQSQFWHGVQNKINDEYNQGRALGEKLRQGMYDVDYANAGWWAVQGFINGANNRAYGYEGVYHTGWWVADTFLKGLKDRGGQGSPWKTTYQSGVFAGEGLVDGLKSMENQVIDEAEVLADGIVNALDLSDTSMSPELNVRGKLAPSMVDGSAVGGGQNIYITQTNNNYTDYDVEQNLADLSYELSKV